MHPGRSRQNIVRCTHDCCGKEFVSRGRRDHHTKFQTHPDCSPECHKFDSYNLHQQKMQRGTLRRRRATNAALCDSPDTRPHPKRSRLSVSQRPVNVSQRALSATTTNMFQRALPATTNNMFQRVVSATTTCSQALENTQTLRDPREGQSVMFPVVGVPVDAGSNALNPAMGSVFSAPAPSRYSETVWPPPALKNPTPAQTSIVHPTSKFGQTTVLNPTTFGQTTLNPTSNIAQSIVTNQSMDVGQSTLANQSLAFGQSTLATSGQMNLYQTVPSLNNLTQISTSPTVISPNSTVKNDNSPSETTGFDRSDVVADNSVIAFLCSAHFDEESSVRIPPEYQRPTKYYHSYCKLFGLILVDSATDVTVNHAPTAPVVDTDDTQAPKSPAGDSDGKEFGDEDDSEGKTDDPNASESDSSPNHEQSINHESPSVVNHSSQSGVNHAPQSGVNHAPESTDTDVWRIHSPATFVRIKDMLKKERVNLHVNEDISGVEYSTLDKDTENITPNISIDPTARINQAAGILKPQPTNLRQQLNNLSNSLDADQSIFNAQSVNSGNSMFNSNFMGPQTTQSSSLFGNRFGNNYNAQSRLHSNMGARGYTKSPYPYNMSPYLAQLLQHNYRLAQQQKSWQRNAAAMANMSGYQNPVSSSLAARDVRMDQVPCSVPSGPRKRKPDLGDALQEEASAAKRQAIASSEPTLSFSGQIPASTGIPLGHTTFQTDTRADRFSMARADDIIPGGSGSMGLQAFSDVGGRTGVLPVGAVDLQSMTGAGGVGGGQSYLGGVGGAAFSAVSDHRTATANAGSPRRMQNISGMAAWPQTHSQRRQPMAWNQAAGTMYPTYMGGAHRQQRAHVQSLFGTQSGHHGLFGGHSLPSHSRLSTPALSHRAVQNPILEPGTPPACNPTWQQPFYGGTTGMERSSIQPQPGPAPSGDHGSASSTSVALPASGSSPLARTDEHC
eukprot:368827_1